MTKLFSNKQRKQFQKVKNNQVCETCQFWSTKGLCEIDMLDKKKTNAKNSCSNWKEL